MIDRYTRIVLTVIAVALSVIAVRQVVPLATAQSWRESGCGGLGTACYVRWTETLPVRVQH